MVVFDATTLLYLLDPEAKPPTDPKTQQPVTAVQARVAHLVETLAKARTKIIIPTPALSEILVRAGDAGPAYLDIVNKSASFRIVPFDQRAAVEVAAALREALDAGDKKGGSKAPWAKLKFDRQILAIAKVEGATTIYSDDSDIQRFAKGTGIEVVPIDALPLPPEKAQQSLHLEDGPTGT
jgi:predicted nucleic acid-binding protein